MEITPLPEPVTKYSGADMLVTAANVPGAIKVLGMVNMTAPVVGEAVISLVVPVTLLTVPELVEKGYHVAPSGVASNTVSCVLKRIEPAAPALAAVLPSGSCTEPVPGSIGLLAIAKVGLTDVPPMTISLDVPVTVLTGEIAV